MPGGGLKKRNIKVSDSGIMLLHHSSGEAVWYAYFLKSSKLDLSPTPPVNGNPTHYLKQGKEYHLCVSLFVYIVIGERTNSIGRADL